MSEESLPVNQGGLRQRMDSCESLDCIMPYSPVDGDDFHFLEATHPLQVLGGLNNLRQEGLFCDVTLCVDGVEFPCHKIVLSSFSSYFKAMFSGDMAESKQNKVSINGVEPEMIGLLVDYAYTSETLVTKSNVQSLLSAANLLEVLPVRDACCRFMERNMDETNCLGIHCFAEAHACVALQERAKSFSLRHFPEVSRQDEFLTLTQAKLIELLSDDELSAEGEETVFQAAVRWLDNDRHAHAPEFHHVLEQVRLPLLSPYFLHDCVAKHDVINSCECCLELLEEAKTYHLLQDRHAELRSPRTRPRKASGKSILILL